MKKQYISPNASVYNLILAGGMLCVSGINNYNNLNNGNTVSTDELNSNSGAWTNKKEHPIWGNTEEGNGYW